MENKNYDVFQEEYNTLQSASITIKKDCYKDNALMKEFKELYSSYKRLLQQSSSLVRISDKRQDHLYRLQSDLKNILNNTGQGILTLSEELVINKGYSAECAAIFKQDIEGQIFTDIIRPFNNADCIDKINAVLNKDFFLGDTLKQKVLLLLLPNEIFINEKSYRIQYKPVKLETKESVKDAFMIILTDITEKKHIQNALDKERQIFKSIVRIVADFSSFTSCVKDYRNFYETRLPELILKAYTNKEEVVNEVMIEVHTLKGNFLIFELTDLTNFLDRIEQWLSVVKDNNHNVTPEQFEMMISQVDFAEPIKKSIDDIRSIMGSKWNIDNDLLFIDANEFIEYENHIRDISQELYQKLHRLRQVNICSLFSMYPDYTVRMATRLGKRVIPFNIECRDEIRVDSDAYEDFARSFVHIFRNIIDHGIEMPDVRVDLGKAIEGNIKFYIVNEDSFIKIVISDDGNGIDVSKIKKKLVQNRILNEEEIKNLSDTDIIQYIFHEGLSTAEPSSVFSGRGVGLSAVLQQTKKLGGHIVVKSIEKIGTAFEFYLPR